jgi:YVTN family beta-propeller protein
MMTKKHAFPYRPLFLAVLLFTLPLAAATDKVRIFQTYQAGDNIHIIDPATNKVVGEIKGVEVIHGIAFAPDGSRLYAANEADNTVDVVDGKTLEVIKKIPASGHVNNIAIGRDGRRLFVGIKGEAIWESSAGIKKEPGAVDIVDTISLKVEKTITGTGPIHNIFVTPDGKYAVSGALDPVNLLSVIDTQTEEIAWQLKFERGIRPFTFSANPDGSTRSIFVQVGSFHGFVVVDFQTRKEVTRITLPELAPGRPLVYGASGASHGVAVTPDQKTLLVDSRLHNALYAYSLPDLKLLGGAELGGHGVAWVTITPDGRTAYVANAVSNDVSVVDIKSLKEVTRIPGGAIPKRNYTVTLPAAYWP